MLLPGFRVATGPARGRRLRRMIDCDYNVPVTGEILHLYRLRGCGYAAARREQQDGKLPARDQRRVAGGV
ncbi:MAG TPA: hypothetical protein DEH78_05315 [Solibacterales bacterium]|nr:hypothetical protein [Bryobacterales bacterium]